MHNHKNNNVRLHDIEEVLEMAETRCNTLKDQLDQMKFYGTKRSGKFPEKMSANGSVLLDEIRADAEMRSTSAVPQVRQKSRQIGTDASGAAVRTINNILNGITNSVNRLVEIHSQSATPRRNRQIGVVPPLEIPSSPGSALPKQKPKDCRSGKSRNFNNNRKKSSSSGIRRRILSRFHADGTANKIVELYHNDALIRHSDSEVNFRGKRHNLTCNQEGATYALPTVASQMKQVTKKYLRTIDLRTIPFCPAISTTQSHNIGINIQQVMNIVKNRQPIDGISPTLAHNIGLAAEKLNARPFAAHASGLASKVPSKCPLSRTRFDASALQEQARTLPEAIEEVDESAALESPQVTSMFITGPSGDVEIKTKKTTTWKNPETEQCTCVPDYQQTQNSIIRTQVQENKSKKRLRKSKSIRNDRNVVGKGSEKSEVPLCGREKDLREVLSHLHCDFEQLNQKYEYLCQKSQNENDASTLPELEKLETELEKKEEEIGMVVALCKEVQALKRQVKQLKDKRSQASLASSTGKFKDYNHPEAAFHLTRLLKQIQHYQMRYKSNLERDLK